MQAAVQSGGPSPRAVIGGGPASSQQLKSSSEVVQNATYSAPIKSKKRERADQSLEPSSKRERSVKSEDGEVSPLKRERSMKPEEIASITDKDGGLLNPAGVERLVQLMQQYRNDGVRKSVDVASRRTLLAGVVALTERDDCLSRFVQLGGLPMLDDWLQEAHKGKVGDGGSPKEGDKGVEELLLTLLKALDKLPVDLEALKTCSVGKSVNHLRSHKNLEIQKKARKLVDIWKKRVDAEMKLSGEVKSASNHGIWSSSYKQNSPDTLHSHLMKTGGPAEAAVKSSGAFAGSVKPMPNGTSSAESVSKAAPVSVGKMSPMVVSATTSTTRREENNTNKTTSSTPAVDLPPPVKEERSSSTAQPQSNGQAWGGGPQGKGVGGSSDSLLPVKDEKCSSTVQPQSNGQTWGGGSQGKGAAACTWKEDVKNASMGGAISSKSIGTGLRHPSLPAKGLLGASRHPSLPGKGLLANLSGSSKELLSGKPLVWSRSPLTDKSAASTPAPLEKVPVEAIGESANPQHRLIVRIPNPGRSPARMNGASVEQVPPGSRALSPNVPERGSSISLDTPDLKGRIQNGSLAATSPAASSDVKSGGAAKLGVEDDRIEFSNSAQFDGLVEGGKRPEESAPVGPECNVKELTTEQNGDVSGFAQSNGPSGAASGPEDGRKVEVGAGAAGGSADGVGSLATAMEADNVGISLLASVAASEIRTATRKITQEKSQPEDISVEQGRSARICSDSTASHVKDACANQQAVKEGSNSKEQMGSTATPNVMRSTSMKGREEVGVELEGEGKTGKPGKLDSKKEGPQERQPPNNEDDTTDCEKRPFAARESNWVLETSGGSGAGKSSLDRKGEDRHVNEAQIESAALPTGSGFAFNQDMKRSVGGFGENSIVSPDGHHVSTVCKEECSDLGLEDAMELSNDYGSHASEPKFSQTVINSPVGDVASQRLDNSIALRSAGPREAEIDVPRSVGSASDRKGPVSVSEAVEAAADGMQELTRRAMDMRTPGSIPSFHSSQILSLPNLSSALAAVSSQHVRPAPQTLPAGEPTTPEQGTETAGPSDGIVGGSDVSERPDFDLNEGFSVEESPQDNSTSSPIPPPSGFTASPLAASGLLAVPIAIVTATKGGFVLPASPLRTKSELGWKGSAATSAFRPAEPLRTLDRQPSTGDSLAPEVSVGSTAKKVHPPLDLNFDLNVVDDRSFEEGGITTSATACSMSLKGSAVGMSAQVPVPPVSTSCIASHSDCTSSGQLPEHVGNSAARPFLDLNMLDESEESGTLIDADTRVPPAGSNRDSSLQATQHVNVVRDFDLNDGPFVEDVMPADQPVLQPLTACNAGASMISMGPGLRRGPEAFSGSWFTASNSFKAAIPEFSSSGAESPYSVAAAAAAKSYFSAGAGSAPFNSELYKASVALPSAPPKVSFPSGTQVPYPYGGFPVSSGFPFPTGSTFSPSNVTPYLDSSGSVNFPIAPSGTVTSHLTRPLPNLMGLSEAGLLDSSSGRSARPSLDLNAGPEALDGDGLREDVVSMRPFTVLGGSPSLDQMRAFRQVVHAAGPVGVPPSKRKEPENGWEMNRSSGFKQQAWR